jgi:hypothetical protein
VAFNPATGFQKGIFIFGIEKGAGLERIKIINR